MEVEVVAGARSERAAQKEDIIERFGKLLDTLTDAEYARFSQPGNEKWLDGELERAVHKVVGRSQPRPVSRIGSGL